MFSFFSTSRASRATEADAIMLAADFSLAAAIESLPTCWPSPRLAVVTMSNAAFSALAVQWQRMLLTFGVCARDSSQFARCRQFPLP